MNNKSLRAWNFLKVFCLKYLRITKTQLKKRRAYHAYRFCFSQPTLNRPVPWTQKWINHRMFQKTDNNSGKSANDSTAGEVTDRRADSAECRRRYRPLAVNANGELPAK